MFFRSHCHNRWNCLFSILSFLLLLGIFLFVISTLQLVSETNKNTFAYNIKTRDTIEEIDKIVERAEVNVNVIADAIYESYDTKKLYDEKYNINYMKKMSVGTKAALMNSPGVHGSWFQLNIDVPFANKAYSWYEVRNGKIIDLKQKFKDDEIDNRNINPTDDPYYFQAIKTKEITWSDVYTDYDTKIPMLTIEEPIYKNGVLIGVVGIDITVKNLNNALKNMQKVFNGSEIFLLDKNNKVISYQLLNDKSIKLNDLNFLNLFGKKNNQEDEKMIEYLDEGIKKTAIMLALSNKYNVVITFPNMLIYKGFDRLLNIVYFILTMLIFLTMISFYNRKRIIDINKQLENDIATIRDIIDYAPTIMAIKNADGVYTACNQNFAKIVGLDIEDIKGKTDYELFDKKTADLIIKKDEKIKEIKGCAVDEYWHICANGEKKYLQKHRIPMFNDKKEIIGILINSIDITKKHLEQESLEHAKDAAERATKMKSSFLANMSHEIRTPMNGVLGFLQLLEDTDPTEEQKEFINNAMKSSEILLNIINEILDFSKIEAGKMKIDKISFDIRSVVEDVMVINTANACKRGLALHSLICSDIPQKVFGDPVRVKQILNNFVNNAIKFTQDGEIVIYVNEISNDGENSVVSFKVKDTGIGISEENLKLIFESFTQADASTTRKYGGTGLGLAISQKFAELMNGNINVESKKDEGSTFTLTIPFKQDHSFKPQIDASEKALNGINVLIVDDNVTNLKIIHYYLNEAYCFINEAHSQEEAIDIINQNENISVILIDYDMENSGEVELSHLLKSNDKAKNIPLILYSSLGQKGDAARSKEKGFVGYLSKPFKKHELVEAIEMAIKNKNENKPEFITKHLIKERKFNSKAKILMVEDTELNCLFVLKLLNNVGLSCDIATEGRSAIKAFQQNKYDLILMDCQMPIMDGYEATNKIRKIENGASHVPIIALTANVLKSDQEKCFEAGMDDCLFKPINKKEFLSLISKYIEFKDENIELDELKTEDETNSEINKMLEEMIEETGFSKDEAVELFNKFWIFLAELIKNIETEIEKEEFENLRQMAHKLKGSSSNLRINEITKLSVQLQEASINKDKETCLEITNQIKDYIKHLNV